jgi:alkylation response protein AidB-like acyl-CoA dehydrogenase
MIGAADTAASLDAFRAEVRQFISENLPGDLRERVERGWAFLNKEDYVFWQKKLHARGWGGPNWPVEYGGTGWTAAQRQVYEDESALACCPRTQPQSIKMIGPILCAYGTEAQKRRFLGPILSADEWWCQGYSEPGAGSDLASLRTRAERVNDASGDYDRVSGHKLWTSLAHWADWMFCLVRTEKCQRPQDGISFLLIDMKSPGLVVRPIVTIDGSHHTNEVFLDDVRVPVDMRIGEEGRGWSYAKALLAHERAGIAELGRSRERLARLKRIVADRSIHGGHLSDDAVFANKVAALEVEIMAAEASTLRLLSNAQGASPALPSMLKLRGSEITQRVGELLLEALGPHALRDDLALAKSQRSDSDPLPSFAIGRVPEYLFQRSFTIAGGSSEVQRNIIARSLFQD